MRVAIPVDDKSIDSGVCISFGRAPYFYFYDVEENKGIFVENVAANSNGGAGILAAQSLVDNKVNALITSRCGENAARVLNSANVSIYKSLPSSVLDNINKLIEGSLDILKEIHEGFHGGK